jgi:phenylacetate-CoA ligase
VIDRKDAMDEVTVLVEADEMAAYDRERRKGGTAETIRKRLAHELGITVDVKLVGKNTIDRSEGKARRVIDRRKL